MKVEWKQSVLLVTIGGQVVPVVRVSELREFLRDIDYADLPYETIREQAKALLASLPKEETR